MFVYKVTNILNNKIYIGVTSQGLDIRFHQHCCNKQKRSTSALTQAISKYGKDNFRIEPLFKCETRDEANMVERLMIKKLNSMSPNGYNIRNGGDSASISEEAKKSISKANSKKVYAVNPETGNFIEFQSIAEAFKAGFHKSAIRDCIKGKLKRHKGYYWSRNIVSLRDIPAHKFTSSKPVMATNSSTGEVLKFKSTKDAAKYINCQEKSIFNALNGIWSHCKGYKWEYQEIE